MPKYAITLTALDAARLERIAADEKRSPSSVVSVLVREGYFRRYTVQGVSTLPAPAGADTVILVDVAEAASSEVGA